MAMKETAHIIIGNTPDKKCELCLTTISDEYNLGEKFQVGDIVVHYFCVVSLYQYSISPFEN